jgi:hypothetical protein
MRKSRITDEQGMRQLNVKLPREDSEFLQEVLRPQLNLPYNAEAVRELISQLRTWFRLPAYVVEALKKDADAQRLHTLGYLQMLLHKRYHLLVSGGFAPPSPKSNPGHSKRG